MSDAEQILRLIADASAETRADLATYGLVIPRFGPKSGIVLKYGYRCLQCNGVALYFVGDRFADHGGNEFEEPPSTVPIDQIPWRQDLDPSRINRHTPECQHCGHVIAMNKRLLRKHLIINLETYRQSRTQAQRELEDLRRSRIVGGRQLSDITGQAAAGLSENFADHHPRRVNDFLTDEARKDIARADQLGLLHRPIGHSTL